MAYCHVLNTAKICLQAVNKGPMAALFQTWPKKWLFYLIIGHIVIQNNNNNNKRKKKRRQLVLVASPVFCFFVPVFYYYYDTLIFFLCQNALTLYGQIGWR